MKPFKNWDSLIKGGGFGFSQKYPNTAFWKGLGLAGKPHLGKDILTPIGTVGYAPFNGVATYVNGNEAGLQMLFQPYGEGFTLRFAHLSRVLNTGIVLEGTPIFLTGNSGSATTAPHCHVDEQIGIHYDFSKLSIDHYRDPLLIDYDRHKAPFYMRPGDSTVYAEIGAKWVAIQSSFEQFLKDFPRADIQVSINPLPIARPTIK